jgi:hypothetical protein
MIAAKTMAEKPRKAKVFPTASPFPEIAEKSAAITNPARGNINNNNVFISHPY